MNSGPLCRCSARARRFGMRHGVYAAEQSFRKSHDEHEFLFSGFSMFSHYKLAKLPTCKVIRFNIEYTILYVQEPAPENFTYLVNESGLLIPPEKLAEYHKMDHYYWQKFVDRIKGMLIVVVAGRRYQKRWRFYVKFRHLIANMAKPTYKDRRRLAAREAKLQEMRTQTKMKRDVTVAISSKGFHTTGLMCDVVQ
ncbi:Uncharacterized protein OBRU01_17871, partial [Operophtera brumata]